MYTPYDMNNMGTNITKNTNNIDNYIVSNDKTDINAYIAANRNNKLALYVEPTTDILRPRLKNNISRSTSSSSSTSHNVVGEGSYGCVHKPSLPCKNRKLNYKNKISKIMRSQDAIDELQDTKLISKIDTKNKYYIGDTVRCKPLLNKRTIHAIKKCKHSKKLLRDTNNISLLVRDDGGDDLEKFADYIHNRQVTPENINMVRTFWKEMYRFVHGFLLMAKNGVLHHDMKPQNILYNMDTNRLNMIDFGFNTTRKAVIRKSQKSLNQFAVVHWSFPMECAFYNKNVFMAFASKSEIDKEAYLLKIIENIKNKSNDNVTSAIKTFLSFVTDKNINNTINENVTYSFLNDLTATLSTIKPSNYAKFIRNSVATIDIYGLGISLLYILFNTKPFLSADLYNELSTLFYDMVSFDVTRRIHTQQFINEFGNTLARHNIIKKRITNVSKYISPPSKHRPSETIHKSISSINRKDIVLTRQEREQNVINLKPFSCTNSNNPKYCNTTQNARQRVNLRKTKRKPPIHKNSALTNYN